MEINQRFLAVTAFGGRKEERRLLNRYFKVSDQATGKERRGLEEGVCVCVCGFFLFAFFLSSVTKFNRKSKF